MAPVPRAHLIAWGLAAVLLLIVGFRFLGGGTAEAPAVQIDQPQPAAEANGADVPAGAPPREGSRPDGELWVHVAGAVARPGLYRVPSGSRIAAAVDAAGGPSRRAEIAGVNLAAPLQDGQQVVVPVRGRAVLAAAGSPGGPAPGSASPGSATPGARLSLSTATVEQLDALDGIGPTLAQRIVEYRDAHGWFRSVDELREIEGIGEKRFEALRDAVVP